MLIQAVNGCVLATEKKNKSILFEDHSTYKIEQVLSIYHASFTYFPLFSLPVLLLHSQNCINIHVQLCIITDHGQHWDGVQRDGPWLQASHSQSQKNGSGCSCTLKSELLRSFAQCRTTTLCIMRRSPRRSWCTEWLSLCKSTPSQEGYEILTMFWLRYYHRITFFYSTFVTIITRWGLSECLSWFAAGMSPESHCFSRLNWKSDLCNIKPIFLQ